jgi:hypothetical protein
MGEIIDDWCHLVSIEFFWPRFRTKEGTQNIGFMCGLLPIGLIMLYMVPTETSTYQSTLIQFYTWKNDPLGTALYLWGRV